MPQNQSEQPSPALLSFNEAGVEQGHEATLSSGRTRKNTTFMLSGDFQNNGFAGWIRKNLVSIFGTDKGFERVVGAVLLARNAGSLGSTNFTINPVFQKGEVTEVNAVYQEVKTKAKEEVT